MSVGTCVRGCGGGGGGGGGGGRYVSRKQQTIKIYIFCKLKKRCLGHVENHVFTHMS